MTAATTRLLFATTILLAAALVFLVQPMVARQLLPTFGGTPAVWNAAVTFFQLALLAAYALAHVSLRLLGPRRQAWLQLGLALVALAFLPFAMRTGSQLPDGVPPAAWVAILLAAGVGVPYLAVASASPVLQRWYAELGQPDSEEPWFLYAASNAGSMLGLLAYPFVLEPRLAVDGQERAWLVAFVAWIALVAACTIVLRRRTAAGMPGDEPLARRHAPTSPPVGPLRAGRWILVAALPVALMLGVTTFVTTDVASAPLLWVVPLALYLSSFVVTFGRRLRIGRRPAGLATGASLLAVLLVELDRVEVGELGRVVVHLLATFAASTLAHATLYADRPAADRLTGFYLLLATGGAIGGAFVSLLAPVAFDDVVEYPLLLGVALLLHPGIVGRGATTARRAATSIVELALASAIVLVLAGAATDAPRLERAFDGDAWPWLAAAAFAVLLLRRAGATFVASLLLALLAFGDDGAKALRSERNFFGTLRVDERGAVRRMLHGTTLHGAQLRGSERARTPTTYYTRGGPLGDVFEHLQRDEPFVEVGAVGLGTGTVLGHARLWQRFTFYEIDPAVIRAATDPDLFTFVPEADVEVRIVEGDARLSLEDGGATYDLLVLDAYSSDAVPVHLLTVEALRTYADRLAPGGVMALHVSSRHLDLEPVAASGARAAGLAALARSDSPSLERRREEYASASTWVVLADDPTDLDALRGVAGWAPPRTRRSGAWTDDFADVARAIRWLPEQLR